MVKQWVQNGTLIHSNDGMVCELSEPHFSQYIQHKSVKYGSRDWEEIMQNGALICAAPDLLHACESARDALMRINEACFGKDGDLHNIVYLGSDIIPALELCNDAIKMAEWDSAAQ